MCPMTKDMVLRKELKVTVLLCALVEVMYLGI